MTELQDRDYQNRVVDNAIKSLDKYNTIMIESPTGSGKTIMGMRILQHLEDKHGYTSNWVAMRRNLLRQAALMNEEFFKLKNINFVSMFDKDPPKADITIVDECVVGETEVMALKDGEEIQTTIDDIMEDDSITHVLSMGDKEEYKEITSRTDMGIKDVYEVIIEDEEGNEHSLYITGNGKIYSNAEYIRVDELSEGDEVLICK